MSGNNSSTTRPVVVLLNWNGLRDTLDCLESLDDMRSVTPFDIVLVDNASSEPKSVDTLSQYASARQNVVFLQNDRNIGFAGGVNTGITYALKGDYTHIALVNNDATVDKMWLKRLLNVFAADKSVAIATGSLLHKDGLTIDSTGEQYSIWGLPFPRLRNKLTSKLPESGYVFGATGGASVYKRELFESIGLFDDAFFAYYEDTDISFRAQLAGWKVYYEREAKAYHTQGASSSKISGFTTKQAIRNLPLLFIKNVPAGLLVPVGARFWLAYLLIFAKALLSKNFSAALTGYIQGVWLFWVHALPARFAIQSKKKVSTKHVKDIMWPDLPPGQTGLRKLFGRKVQ